MKGLLLQDCYLMKITWITATIVMAVLLPLNYMYGANLTTVFFIFAIYFALYSIHLDKVSGDCTLQWKQYSVTMPVSRKDIVKSKYAINLASLTGIIILYSIISAPFLLLGAVDIDNLLLQIELSILITLYWTALATTLLMFVDRAKNKIVSGTARFIYGFTTGIMIYNAWIFSASSLAYRLGVFYTPFLIGSIFVLIGSYIISCKLYEKQDLS